MKKIVLDIAVVLMASIAGMAFGAKNSNLLPPSTKPIEQDNAAQENDVTGSIVISSCEEPYPREKLIEESTLVIRGRVEGAEVLTISGVNGGSAEMTHYRIHVLETLRGEEKETVTVQRLGNVESTQVIFNDEPSLEQNKEYILFLQAKNIGGDFNIKDEYYSILGGMQGVYEKSASNSEAAYISLSMLEGDSDFSTETTAPQKAVTYSQLQNQVEQCNLETPVDPYLFRDSYLKALRTNIETGFLTEEEYQEALNELEEYAEVTSRKTLW